MKYAYPAVFTQEGSGHYSVNFPDLEGCYTTGDNISDAVSMAQDVLCLTLYDLEQDKEFIPSASNPKDILLADNEFLSIVVADTEFYQRFYETKAVKKTLTIPMWLNERAEQANINFSGLLQAALKERLQI